MSARLRFQPNCGFYLTLVPLSEWIYPEVWAIWPHKMLSFWLRFIQCDPEVDWMTEFSGLKSEWSLYFHLCTWFYFYVMGSGSQQWVSLDIPWVPACVFKIKNEKARLWDFILSVIKVQTSHSGNLSLAMQIALQFLTIKWPTSQIRKLGLTLW